jgi:ethanolamine ammonia-lyase small subunit
MAKSTPAPVIANPWQSLRKFTSARIALGRAGVSLPTRPLLEFQFAHARARDAVHLPLDRLGLCARLEAAGYPVIELHSAAADRNEYLQRPDLGRRLNEASRARLQALAGAGARNFDLAFVVADGLSALAVNQHALAMLGAVRPRLVEADWHIAPVALIEQGRVASGDEIGELLDATMVAVLIGERPGLSSPDSLGIYLTYRPSIGKTDADRNCISNVRPRGLSFAVAAHKLFYLMNQARHRRLSGVKLKDEADTMEHALDDPITEGNFLTHGDT